MDSPTKSILVGDIGSTKSSWYISGDHHRHINLPGFNPIVHGVETGEKIINALANQIKDELPADIYYYGAGVVDVRTADSVRHLLSKEFPSSQLHVSTDLEGAARASCGLEEGTIAILGTGSHAAIYDGLHITRQANALGYILGDEGGGSDIGKALVQAYFYNQMPEIIRVEMQKILHQGRAHFLKELYTSATPNQYLGELGKVAAGFDNHPWIEELITERFSLFVRRHLIPLEPIGPVHVLGSIGSIFARLIEKELNRNELKAGLFIRDPSYRLFEMHMNYDFSE